MLAPMPNIPPQMTPVKMRPKGAGPPDATGRPTRRPRPRSIGCPIRVPTGRQERPVRQEQVTGPPARAHAQEPRR
jgi:hypothetical protein